MFRESSQADLKLFKHKRDRTVLIPHFRLATGGLSKRSETGFGTSKVITFTSTIESEQRRRVKKKDL